MTLKLVPDDPIAPIPAPDDATVVARVLVVDDESTIRTALARFLRMRGFHSVPVASGAAALEAMQQQHFEVMVCDVRMPGMTGLELIAPALAREPDLAIVMLSAVNDAVTASTALSRGAANYLVKPIELTDLHRAVMDALARRESTIEHRRSEQQAQGAMARVLREADNDRTSLRSLTVEVAHSLISAIETKTSFLSGHSERVSELAKNIAVQLGLDEATVEAVRIAGLLHDVGTAGISEQVLGKAGALTPSEMAHVQQHVRIGMEILSPLRYLGRALDYVCDHHEHFDGRGYPRGVSGEAISLGGRILAAADSFDALTSPRPYREPISAAAAVVQLEGHSGTLLDPAVLDGLRLVIARREETLTA
jgi:putative two-component system response regulator